MAMHGPSRGSPYNPLRAPGNTMGRLHGSASFKILAFFGRKFAITRPPEPVYIRKSMGIPSIKDLRIFFEDRILKFCAKDVFVL